jgi:hypothetical protein
VLVKLGDGINAKGLLKNFPVATVLLLSYYHFFEKKELRVIRNSFGYQYRFFVFSS